MSLCHARNALRFVQRSLPDEALCHQLAAACQRALGGLGVGLGFAHRLLGARRLHLAQLPQAGTGLLHRLRGLRRRCLQLRRFQFDQQRARRHCLAFDHGHAQHRTGDLHAQLHPVWRLDATAGHHGLHEIALRDGLHRHLGTEQPAGAEHHTNSQYDEYGQHLAPVVGSEGAQSFSPFGRGGGRVGHARRLG